jgi:hypothetical protein
MYALASVLELKWNGMTKIKRRSRMACRKMETITIKIFAV